MSDNDPYRRIAGVYDRLIEPMQAGVRRVALDVIPPEPGWQVLDVGCGTGTGMARYVEAGCTAVGVDVSAAMLDKAKARLGVQTDLHLTDGNTLPFDDGCFDLVTTSMVLHEVPTDARTTFVAEMARVSKPSNALLFIDFRFGSLRGWKGPTLRGLSEVIEGSQATTRTTGASRPQGVSRAWWARPVLASNARRSSPEAMWRSTRWHRSPNANSDLDR